MILHTRLSVQDRFVKEMTVLREKQRQKKLVTEKGWYSVAEMKDQLAWDE